VTRTTVRIGGAVLALVVATQLAACNPGTSPTSTPTATRTSSTPTPVPSPTTTSPEDQAAAQAEEVVRNYYRAEVQCLVDPPHTPMSCYDNVAITTELDNLRNSLVSAQAMATRVSGDIEVVSVDRESVDMTVRVPGQAAAVPVVTLSVCRDVSKFNIVDKDGNSIVPPDRKPRGRVEMHVANYKYPDASQWRVAFVVVPKDPSC